MRYAPEALVRAHSEDPIPFNVAGIPLHACQHVDRRPSSTARFVTAAHGRLILEDDLPRPAVAGRNIFIYSHPACERITRSLVELLDGFGADRRKEIDQVAVRIAEQERAVAPRHRRRHLNQEVANYVDQLSILLCVPKTLFELMT